ncbi:hypothetical protein, partial [Paraburkholderia heleia]|uniref:hypothetical protein n=1 Tax=Paraburkholderia heleia TaxID=634127 RepID=UPI002AB7F101
SRVQAIQTTDATMSAAATSAGLLVQAMASLGAPPSTQTTCTPAGQTALAPLLAAVWQRAS